MANENAGACRTPRTSDQKWLILVCCAEIAIAVFSLVFLVDFLAPSDQQLHENATAKNTFDQQGSELVRGAALIEVALAALALFTLIAVLCYPGLSSLLGISKWLQILIAVSAFGFCAASLLFLSYTLISDVRAPNEVVVFLGVKINAGGFQLSFLSYCCLFGVLGIIGARLSHLILCPEKFERRRRNRHLSDDDDESVL